MKKSSTRKQRELTNHRPHGKSKALIPALFAVGTGMAAVPASALEIGEIVVHSNLGQPLRASIAFALGPNETLADNCVSLAPAIAGAGLPSISRASISVANGVIALSGSQAIREPMVTTRLNVACPYTPRLSREYTLFIDPATTTAVTENTDQARPEAAPPEPVVTTAAPVSVARVSRPAVVREPVETGSRYRVQPGDSLSEIAQRLEGRQIGLWNAVDVLFEANPDAFINDDPNQLMAGSWLDIPLSAATGVAEEGAAPTTTVEAQATVTVTETGSAYSMTETLPDSGIVDDTNVLSPATPADDVADETSETTSDLEPYAGLQPGDVVIDATAGTESITSIPETALEVPDVASSPNVPVAGIQTTVDEPASTNWFVWLIAAGVGIFVGLLFFGRRSRGGTTTAPSVALHPQRRASDSQTVETLAAPQIDVIETAEPQDELDYDLSDDSPTQENLALDADLVIGTGLDKSTDVDVTQDFAFAATTVVDVELPEEMSSGYDETRSTDIIPPLKGSEVGSILESEVLPEDDDYDMSVIVDATKMPNPDDATERDLKAVPVDDSDKTLIDDSYTLSQEVDYHVLEQDYEDEMTATQALNMEIEKAAADLAKRMDDDPIEATGEVTNEMPLATVTDIESHARAKAGGNDDEDTVEEITVNLTADDKTEEMPLAEDETAETSLVEDKTAEMPADDDTAEMKARTK